MDESTYYQKLLNYNKLKLEQILNKYYMDDELTRYLKLSNYNKFKLEQILNKKIIITKDHIDNIEIKHCCDCEFNIIEIFEKYGYVFTNDDYMMLLNRCIYAIQFIPNDKQTNKMCKMAVQRYAPTLRFISENNKTDEICEIAVQRYVWAIRYVPEDKITDKICKIAVQQCELAVYCIPANKKYLFIKNEIINI